MIYHLSSKKIPLDQDYLGPNVQREGFLHCSYPEQLEQTAQQFYKNEKELYALAIDPDQLISPLKIERAPSGGGFYPHIYGIVQKQAIQSCYQLRGKDYNWHFPALTQGFYIRPYSNENRNELIGLWERCGLTRPWNDPKKDIERHQSSQKDLLFLAWDKDKIAGSIMAGFDGHRGWIYYLAVDPESQGRGWGRRLVSYAEQELFKIGCPKIELMVRDSNSKVLDWYDKIGYQIEPVKVLSHRLIED